MSIKGSQVKPSGIRSNGKHPGGRTKLHCLITGFDPFAGQSFNPSQAVVESLPEHLNLRQSNLVVHLEGVVLPTCGDLAWQTLKKSLDKVPKDAHCIVILTGMAAKRSVITLERFALNVRDYRVEDNNGHNYAGDEIAASGPQARRTDVPIENLLKRLRRRGLPSEISNYCGTFVCNEIYYQALSFQHMKKKPDAVLFVHLPKPSAYGKSLLALENERAQKRGKGKSNQMQAMQEAIFEIVQSLCENTIAG